MTTPIAQHPEAHTARKELPPVEKDVAVESSSLSAAAKAPSETQDDLVAPAPAKQSPAPTQRQKAIGKWLHEHRHATDGGIGYLGYQIVRNMAAAVPYGITTAATWMGFEKIAESSQAKAVGKLVAKGTEAAAATKQIAANPTTMMRFMRSPARDIAMIAVGFTLYRGTLKVVRYMKERLFNPNHTEEQSVQEVQNFGANLKETLKEVGPAELASTPAAAFALGLGRRLYVPKASVVNMDTHSVTGMFFNKTAVTDGVESIVKGIKPGTRLQRLKNVYNLKNKGGLWSEIAIIAASFVPFFELGDRRYKDAQVSRGIWLNDPTSLVRKSDEQAQQELDEHKVFANNAPASGKFQDDIAQKSAESLKATGHLRPTDAPTISCFAMRRVVPTFIGIGLYVAGKRLAYMGMGTMQENYKSANWLSSLGKMALVEGAATSLFWLNTMVIDKFEPWYDKTFKDSKPKPLTDPEIRRHYAELKDRLDAKERERSGKQPTVA